MVDDIFEEMLAEMRAIRENTGTIGDGIGPDYDTSSSAIRSLPASNYMVRESADLDEANDDGTISCPPGEVTTIVEAENITGGAIGLMAVGAQVSEDVRYRLIVDRTTPVGGSHNSPLGTVNSPFSFVDEFGAVIPAYEHIRYEAIVSNELESPVDLAARIHVEQGGGNA